MKKIITWGLVIVGGLVGVVWYFDVNQAGESWSDILSDPIGTFMDLISRVQAQATGAVSTDPTTIAAGLIAQFEGFVGHAYQDAVGVWTIGYGHKIVNGDGFQMDESQLITQSDAMGLLQADLDTVVNCVDNAVTVDLTPNQKAACYSFTYNEGCGAFTSSTLLKKINQGDLSGATDEFARWVYAGNPKQVLQALVNRRSKEADTFAADISTDQGGSNA